MFIQTQNPFSELSKITQSPISSYRYRNASTEKSKTIAWVVGVLTVVGGVVAYIFWRRRQAAQRNQQVENGNSLIKNQ